MGRTIKNNITLFSGVVTCCRFSQVDERRRCVMVDGPSSFFYCRALGNCWEMVQRRQRFQNLDCLICRSMLLPRSTLSEDISQPLLMLLLLLLLLLRRRRRRQRLLVLLHDGGSIKIMAMYQSSFTSSRQAFNGAEFRSYSLCLRPRQRSVLAGKAPATRDALLPVERTGQSCRVKHLQMCM